MTASPDPAQRAAEVSRFPTGPAERHFGMRSLDYGIGWMTAEQRLPAGAGATHIGWLGPLIDFAMGRAVQSSLVADVGIRTVGIHIDASSRGVWLGDLVSARAEVLDMDGRGVLAAVRIHARDGALLGAATGRFLIVPGVIAPGGDYIDGVSNGGPEGDALDLHLGARAVASAAGTATFVAPASKWMTNPYGIAHGGIPVALADLGLTAAARSAIAGPVRTLDLNVTFHRPAMIGAEDLMVHAVVERKGKGVVVASARVFQADRDRPIATATSTLLRV